MDRLDRASRAQLRAVLNWVGDQSGCSRTRDSMPSFQLNMMIRLNSSTTAPVANCQAGS